MRILHQEEFYDRSKQGANSLERVYEGTALEGGPVFSVGQLSAAKLYCQRFIQKNQGANCFIVQEQGFLRIWSEVGSKEADAGANLENEEISIDSLPVEAEFASFCQKLLAEYIGPIAGMICKKTLAKKPNLTRTQFVTILAKKISDPSLAQKFREATLE